MEGSNIFLVGAMGSGKSSVGKALAETSDLISPLFILMCKITRLEFIHCKY